MTLSGQGLNFTFLLKENGKQNKKAVQTSVNLGEKVVYSNSSGHFLFHLKWFPYSLPGASGGCLMQLGVGWVEMLCRGRAEHRTLTEMEHYPLTPMEYLESY